jgi:hypothetical protein
MLCVQVGGAGLAVMDDPKRGIQFGAEGLSIPLTAGSNARTAKSRLGTFYAKNSALPERGRSLFSTNDSLKHASDMLTYSVLLYYLDCRKIRTIATLTCCILSSTL